MNSIKIDTYAGDYLPKVLEKAIQMSDGYDYAYFDFNGITVAVNSESDLELVNRDIFTAHLLGWKRVGPIYMTEYSEHIQQEIVKRTEQRRLENEELERIAKAERIKVEQITQEAIAQYPMFIFSSLRKEYQEFKDIQQDGYEKAVFDLAEKTAAISRFLASQTKTHLGVVLEEASYVASNACGGCSGYQWSIAQKILERYWLYGDIVKRTFSKQHDQL